VPWAVLSGGINFPAFLGQVEIACRNGASGFVAGRAIWSEALTIRSTVKRDAFLAAVAVKRLQELSDAALMHGRSVARLVETPRFNELEDWHARYYHSN
jgi:tagatose 1,6-diphosphate aldolase